MLDLETFAAVARHGDITRAAGALNTVQSNVTARLQVLERELGARLFERHSRGVVLTAAGQRLLPYAGRIRALVDEARRVVADDGIPRGPLRLGAMETTAALRLPPLLARYARAFPEVELVVGTGPTATLVQEVLEHRLDAALVAGPVAHPELVEQVAFEEELVLVTAPDLPGLEPLAGMGELKVLVFRAGCSYRQRLEATLAARGIAGVRRLEFGTLDGIVGCVAAGVGVTLLPRRCRGSLARRADRPARTAGSRGAGHDGAGPPPRRLCVERARRVPAGHPGRLGPGFSRRVAESPVQVGRTSFARSGGRPSRASAAGDPNWTPCCAWSVRS
nr:LysR family transcriptional regulator [Paracraurococcus ruber]